MPPAYEPWLIETKDGETYSGFVISDGATATLKEPSGNTRAIPAKQIASRQQQRLSLMPDNISLGLTPEELVDLVEYLMREAGAGGRWSVVSCQLSETRSWDGTAIPGNVFSKLESYLKTNAPSDTAKSL